MSHRVFFLNGPNANLYGLDKNGTYGSESFASIEARCQRHAAELGLTLDFRQSNHEGVLVDWIQEARLNADAIVIMPPGSPTARYRSSTRCWPSTARSSKRT